MKLRTKKRIAKEVLLLFACGILFGLISFSVYPYNWYYKQKVDEIREHIAFNKTIADTCCVSFNKKLQQQDWFFNEFVEKFGKLPEKYDTSDKLWSFFEKKSICDSLLHKYDQFSKTTKDKLGYFGFNSGIALNNFILNNFITVADIKNKEKSNIKRREMQSLELVSRKYKAKIMCQEEHKSFSLIILIIILGLLYPIRFLFLLIWWSIKTVKLKT